ncbi:hypothetical protein ACQP2F_04270 [Actinoplanes sp. CA-030573]
MEGQGREQAGARGAMLRRRAKAGAVIVTVAAAGGALGTVRHAANPSG